MIYVTGHRFDDKRGLRRYKIQSKLSSPGEEKEGALPLLPYTSAKKLFDHSPHAVRKQNSFLFQTKCKITELYVPCVKIT